MKTPALLAVLLLSACSPGNRMGVVNPVDKIVTSDPSPPDGGGLPAQVGTVVTNGSDKAWQKYGTGDTKWQLQGHGVVVFDSRDFNAGATLNLMTTTTNYLLTATLPGYYCVPVPTSGAIKFVGTATSGSTPVQPTGNIGNNSTTRTNWAASAGGVPVGNSGFTTGAPYAVNATIGSVTGLADLSTPVGLDVTVAATTATTWAGYFLTSCYLFKY